MMSPLVLVLDQGGQGSRGLVFDAGGNVVAAASVPVATARLQATHIEQDPAGLLHSLHGVLEQVAGQLAGRCAGLVGAALIVQRSSLLAWDRVTRQPLSAVLSWQDTRHAAWLEALVAGQRDRIRDMTGLYPNAHYGASKMRWLLDNVPAVRQAAAADRLCLTPLASYLQQQLTGAAEPLVDAVIASRTLLTSLGSMDWSPVLLDLFGIPETVLPAIRPTLAGYGSIRVGDTAIPLCLLGGDQSFFALSHAALFDDNTVFINAGTGVFLQQRMPATRVPHNLLCAPLRLGDNPVLVAEGTVNAAAAALVWFWQQAQVQPFGHEAWQAAMRQATAQPLAVPIFCNRLTASGSPDWLPAGESAFSCPAPVPLQAIAVLESIVFAIQRNLACLAAVSACHRIVLSGGLAQLPLFAQCIADLSGQPVLRGEDVEACARGAAMQLLPEAAGVPDYHEYLPRQNPHLHARYHQWHTLMDQPAGC